MTARMNGRATWNTGVQTEEQKDIATDKAFKMVLETLQRAVVYLVNSRDTQRLIALQACTNQLYKNANGAMDQGKEMGVALDD